MMCCKIPIYIIYSISGKCIYGLEYICAGPAIRIIRIAYIWKISDKNMQIYTTGKLLTEDDKNRILWSSVRSLTDIRRQRMMTVLNDKTSENAWECSGSDAWNRAWDMLR